MVSSLNIFLKLLTCSWFDEFCPTNTYTQNMAKTYNIFSLLCAKYGRKTKNLFNEITKCETKLIETRSAIKVRNDTIFSLTYEFVWTLTRRLTPSTNNCLRKKFEAHSSKKVPCGQPQPKSSWLMNVTKTDIPSEVKKVLELDHLRIKVGRLHTKGHKV